MGQMVIRNIPDDVLERFKAQARAEGKSAEQFARDAIAAAAKLSRADRVSAIDSIRARTRTPDPQTVERLLDEARQERDGRSGKELVDGD